jgi:hypothetical protein
MRSLALLICFAVALVTGPACGRQKCATTTPQPEATATPTAGPGQLDPELAKLAFDAQGVHKIKLKIDATGKVVKLAVYHRDASKVSEALAKAVEEKFPGATILYYENESYAEHGPVHEVEFTTADGRKCELSRKADGQDLYTECELAADALPQAVADAVRGTVAGGEIVEAESKEWADGQLRYHVEIRAGEDLHYLVFDAEGKLVERYLRIPAFVDLASE